MGPGSVAVQFGLEQRGEVEGVLGQLGDAYLAIVVMAGETQAMRGQRTGIAWVQAVGTAIALQAARGAEDPPGQ